MVDVLLTSVELHNGLLGLLFLCALLNFGAVVFQVSRCENCHKVHDDMLRFKNYTGSFPAVVTEETNSSEPGLYFPQESDEARAINEKAAVDAAARNNPFRGWDIYSPDEEGE